MRDAPRKTPTDMDLGHLMATYTTGDYGSWEQEAAWLRTHHPRRLARIRMEIARGHLPPVQLDHEERRVVDGHHRIIAAHDLGLRTIPTDDAWRASSEWWRFASSQGGDDPRPEQDPNVYTLEDVARITHETIRTMQITQDDPCPAAPWDDAPEVDREGIRTAVRMVIDGADADDLNRAWNHAKQAAGYTNGPKDHEARTHPCVGIPRDELDHADRAKDDVIVALVLALHS